MKTFLLMSKATGELVEGKRVWFCDFPNGLSIDGFVLHWEFWKNPDGWIVTAPKKYFAGLWVYVTSEHVEREFEVIGEV